jgi:AcrR family transcriptional regulator
MTGNRSEPGSARWWREHSARVRRAPGREGRSKVLEIALQIVDLEGPRALTMRRLASELHTGPATLYGYFDSRDALLAELVDESLASFELPSPPPDVWYEGALETARRFRSTLLAHPNLLPLLPTGQLAGPNALRVLEAAISGMVDYGFTIDQAAQTVMIGTHYVMGFCIQESGGQIPSSQDRREYHRFLKSLSTAEFPTLVKSVPSLVAMSANEEFEIGLRLLLSRTGSIDSPHSRRHGTTRSYPKPS